MTNNHNGDSTKTLVSLRDYVDLLNKEIRDDIQEQKEYFESKITANDRIYTQRFDSSEKEVNSALVAADRAVNKAEIANEKRFDSVNEFRNTLADQQRNLMPRNESELLFRAINEKVDSLNLTTISRQGESKGISQGWGWAVGIVGFIVAIVSLLSKFTK